MRSCAVSRTRPAHGTAIDGQDDRDEMGVFVEPPENVCGLTLCVALHPPRQAGGRAQRPRCPGLPRTSDDDGTVHRAAGLKRRASGSSVAETSIRSTRVSRPCASFTIQALICVAGFAARNNLMRLKASPL
jgi:hypothetical protein